MFQAFFEISAIFAIAFAAYPGKSQDGGILSATQPVAVAPQVEGAKEPQQDDRTSGDDEGGTAGGAEGVALSFYGNTAIPGVGVVRNEDIVEYSPPTNSWSFVFDGSDVGLDALTIDAFTFAPDGSIYFSFREPGNIAGLLGGPAGTAVDDSDIVAFIPTSLGANTAGGWVFVFDGSDIGFTTDGEDIDALALSPAGNLLISTVGNFNGGSSFGDDKDVMEFTATSLGAATSGVFNIYFDGTDVQLGTAEEDIDALALTEDGRLLLSTVGKFLVLGIPGGDADILAFTPTTLGSVTIGTFAILFDDLEIGIPAPANIGGMEVVPAHP